MVHGEPNRETATPIAVAVVEDHGRVLIGLRPPGVPLAGFWEFPGGKVQVGETPQQAAARECREETGIDVRVGPAYPKVVHQYEHSRVELNFFACEPLEATHKLPERFRWVRRDELANYCFPPANAQVIALLTGRPQPSSDAACCESAARGEC